MLNTRLSGHSLRKEGQPYALELCGECSANEAGTWRDEHGNRSRDKEGHGLCSCGVVSPHFASDNRRRKWHVVHKITEAQEGR
jgi:hypothetical protein